MNLTSLEVDLIHHDEPFIEDSPAATWPPVSQLTFEAAFARWGQPVEMCRTFVWGPKKCGESLFDTSEKPPEL